MNTETDLFLQEKHKINLHLWIFKNDKFISSYWTKNSATESWIKERLDDQFGANGWTHYERK